MSSESILTAKGTHLTITSGMDNYGQHITEARDESGRVVMTECYRSDWDRSAAYCRATQWARLNY